MPRLSLLLFVAIALLAMSPIEELAGEKEFDMIRKQWNINNRLWCVFLALVSVLVMLLLFIVIAVAVLWGG